MSGCGFDGIECAWTDWGRVLRAVVSPCVLLCLGGREELMKGETLGRLGRIGEDW